MDPEPGAVLTRCPHHQPSTRNETPGSNAMAIYLSLKVAVMCDGMQGRIPPETTVSCAPLQAGSTPGPEYGPATRI